MECIHPYILEGQEFPCGKCRACRVNHTREWALRLMHERQYWDDAIFLTLTYSDDHLPTRGTLVKRDVQLFIKRVRKDLIGRVIRYYAVGEYGEKTNRPHYHAIMFGLSYDDSELIRENWELGFIKVGYVTYQSCRYVAEYCQKKLGGKPGREKYGSREYPFQLCSKGIGARWAIDNQKRLMDNLYITSEGKKFGIPRYYRKKLDIEADEYDPLVMDRLNAEDDWFEARQIKGEQRKAYKRARKEQKDEELKSIEQRRNKCL